MTDEADKQKEQEMEEQLVEHLRAANRSANLLGFNEVVNILSEVIVDLIHPEVFDLAMRELENAEMGPHATQYGEAVDGEKYSASRPTSSPPANPKDAFQASLQQARVLADQLGEEEMVEAIDYALTAKRADDPNLAGQEHITSGHVVLMPMSRRDGTIDNSNGDSILAAFEHQAGRKFSPLEKIANGARMNTDFMQINLQRFMPKNN